MAENFILYWKVHLKQEVCCDRHVDTNLDLAPVPALRYRETKTPDVAGNDRVSPSADLRATQK